MKKEKNKKTNYAKIHTVTAILFAVSGMISLLNSGFTGFTIIYIGLAITYASISSSYYKKEKAEKKKEK